MSRPSAADTAVRGVVMLVVLGGGGWGALQYPPVCGRAKELLARWELGTLFHAQDEVAQARLAGGDAPPFSAAPLTTEPLTTEPPATIHFDDHSRPLAQQDQPASLYPAQQVDYRRDVDPAMQVEGATGGNGGGVHGATPLSAVATLADLDTQLRQLGATYCLLERWQENPPHYRFHCRVQLSPGTEARRFEASGPDPARVMQDVAEAVAAYRAERGR